MTTLERAARALCESVNEGDLWDEIPTWLREKYRSHARAVLMAVREPDGDMVRAGHNADPLGDGVEKAGLIYVPIFTAMIDDILNDGEGE